MSIKRIISLNLLLNNVATPPHAFPYPVYVCPDRDSIIERIIFDFANPITDSAINYAFWKIINAGKDGLGTTVIGWITNNNIDYPANYKNMASPGGVEITLLSEYHIAQNEVLIFDKEVFGDPINTNTNKSTITIFERRK